MNPESDLLVTEYVEGSPAELETLAWRDKWGVLWDACPECKAPADNGDENIACVETGPGDVPRMVPPHGARQLTHDPEPFERLSYAANNVETRDDVAWVLDQLGVESRQDTITNSDIRMIAADLERKVKGNPEQFGSWGDE
jgi:predicted 3-demethylubiquinone-9 3-methyltransferase (glyoxalase superfamily)